ncbi:MAG TPA: hypothetical protein VFG13_10135, partial [Blastococcus sp.]|nr:hypothetical protein [Blastococcus sp.]
MTVLIDSPVWPWRGLAFDGGPGLGHGQPLRPRPRVGLRFGRHRIDVAGRCSEGLDPKTSG